MIARQRGGLPQPADVERVDGAEPRGTRLVPQQFFPSSDRPELLIDLQLPENSSIYATRDLSARIDKLLTNPNSFPVDIVGGSDGALWFTEAIGNRIGRLVPDPVPEVLSRPDTAALLGDPCWFDLPRPSSTVGLIMSEASSPSSCSPTMPGP